MPSFSFSYDADVEAVVLTIEGFWSMQTVEDYRCAVLANLAARPPGTVVTKMLVDLRHSELHRTSVERALADFHHGEGPRVAKMAVAVRSSLDAEQAMRISAADETRTFATIEEALCWLA